MINNFKSGFVTIVGRPNVGKSTLINQLIGERISIISNKPQTTRNSIKCILTKDEFQIVFIDTPGIHKPKTKLGNYMVKSATESVEGVDVIIMMLDCTSEVGGGDRFIMESLKDVKIPVILALNKVDKLGKARLEIAMASLLPYQEQFAAIVPISAAEGTNVDQLLKEVVSRLEVGPMYYDADMITDIPEKFVVAEIIREKILKVTDEEIPHGTAVEIMSMRERDNKNLVDIDATIYCEKDSHKAILIGKSGTMLKKIGTYSREDIEKLLNCKVNLQLWVKVRKNWRDSQADLKTLGYK